MDNFGKRGCKGQFYLMATIIIIGILIGILTISNYSIKKERSSVYDLSEELKIEGEKVIDYETTTSESVFDDFAERYSDYAGNNIDIYFIYGELGSMEVFKYEQDERDDYSYGMDGNNLTISLEGVDYSFELKEGRNFHFIMLEKAEEEEYVVSY
jgi:hypothetical protein